jgi:hypothetical protein
MPPIQQSSYLHHPLPVRSLAPIQLSTNSNDTSDINATNDSNMTTNDYNNSNEIPPSSLSLSSTYANTPISSMSSLSSISPSSRSTTPLSVSSLSSPVLSSRSISNHSLPLQQQQAANGLDLSMVAQQLQSIQQQLSSLQQQLQISLPSLSIRTPTPCPPTPSTPSSPSPLAMATPYSRNNISHNSPSISASPPAHAPLPLPHDINNKSISSSRNSDTPHDDDNGQQQQQQQHMEVGSDGESLRRIVNQLIEAASIPAATVARVLEAVRSTPSSPSLFPSPSSLTRANVPIEPTHSSSTTFTLSNNKHSNNGLVSMSIPSTSRVGSGIEAMTSLSLPNVPFHITATSPSSYSPISSSSIPLLSSRGNGHTYDNNDSNTNGKIELSHLSSSRSKHANSSFVSSAAISVSVAPAASRSCCSRRPTTSSDGTRACSCACTQTECCCDQSICSCPGNSMSIQSHHHLMIYDMVWYDGMIWYMIMCDRFICIIISIVVILRTE